MLFCLSIIFILRASSISHDSLRHAENVIAFESDYGFGLKHSNLDYMPIRNEVDDFTFNICHISDFHGAIEKFFLKDSKTKSPTHVCQSGYMPSNLGALAVGVEKADCDLVFFTGDLLENNNSYADPFFTPNLLEKLKVDYWLPGNAEFGSKSSSRIQQIVDSPHYTAKMVLSNIGFNAPVNSNKPLDAEYNRHYKVLEKARKSYVKTRVQKAIGESTEVCIYGVINPSLLYGVLGNYNYLLEDHLVSLRKTIEESAKDGCLNNNVLRVIMTHVGLAQDKKLLAVLKKSFPTVNFPIILGGHDHIISESYEISDKNATVIDHVGSFGGFFSKLVISDNYQIDKTASKLYSTEVSRDRAFLPYYSLSIPESRTISYIFKDFNMFGEVCNYDADNLSLYREYVYDAIRPLMKPTNINLPLPKHKSPECKHRGCLNGDWIANALYLAAIDSNYPINCEHNNSAEVGQEKLESATFMIDIDSYSYVISLYHSGGLSKTFSPDLIDPSIYLHTEDFDNRSITKAELKQLLKYQTEVRFIEARSPREFCQVLFNLAEDSVSNESSLYYIHSKNFNYTLDMPMFKECQRLEQKCLFSLLLDENTNCRRKNLVSQFELTDDNGDNSVKVKCYYNGQVEVTDNFWPRKPVLIISDSYFISSRLFPSSMLSLICSHSENINYSTLDAFLHYAEKALKMLS